MVIVPFAINVMGFLLEAGQQVFFGQNQPLNQICHPPISN